MQNILTMLLFAHHGPRMYLLYNLATRIFINPSASHNFQIYLILPTPLIGQNTWMYLSKK